MEASYEYDDTGNKTLWALGIVGAVCLLAVLHLALFDRATRAVIRLELAKLLLDVLVIAILGGIVKLLFDDFASQRRRLEAESGFRKAFLDRVIAAYMEAKRTRRELRAPQPYSQESELKKSMAALNDVELDLETLKNEVETSRKAFSAPNALARNIESMADYLRGVTAENEIKKPDSKCAVREGPGRSFQCAT